MESALKKHRYSKQKVIKHRLHLLIQAVLENLLYCFLTQKHCFTRDVNKISYNDLCQCSIIKPVIIAIFHIDPAHRNPVAEMHPLGSMQFATKTRSKHA